MHRLLSSLEGGCLLHSEAREEGFCEERRISLKCCYCIVSLTALCISAVVMEGALPIAALLNSIILFVRVEGGLLLHGVVSPKFDGIAQSRRVHVKFVDEI
jgi:hypothetical protein